MQTVKVLGGNDFIDCSFIDGTQEQFNKFKEIVSDITFSYMCFNENPFSSGFITNKNFVNYKNERLHFCYYTRDGIYHNLLISKDGNIYKEIHIKEEDI